MDPPFYSALRQMNEERAARERVAIGVPVILPPHQMRAEHEAWVAMGVPLIEPRPQRKPRPCEKHLIRCFLVAWGIMSTVWLFLCDGPLTAKIFGACMIWVIPIGIIRITFRSDDLPEDTVET